MKVIFNAISSVPIIRRIFCSTYKILISFIRNTLLPRISYTTIVVSIFVIKKTIEEITLPLLSKFISHQDLIKWFELIYRNIFFLGHSDFEREFCFKEKVCSYRNHLWISGEIQINDSTICPFPFQTNFSRFSLVNS